MQQNLVGLSFSLYIKNIYHKTDYNRAGNTFANKPKAYCQFYRFMRPGL